MNFLKKLKDVFTKSVDNTSAGSQLDKIDWAKLTRDTLLVGGSAVVAYLLEKVPSLNFGEMQTFVVPAVTFCLTAVMRFLRDNQK